MADTPAVSVLLPVHNGARHLRESIDSVLAQTFTPFELVVCDDGSTDESPAVVAACSDPRMRVLRNDRNRGLFTTLNRLVADSRGPLVRLWAQDDRMYPGGLERHVEFHRAHAGIAMSYCRYHTMDAAGRVDTALVPDATPVVLAPDQASEIMFFHGSITGNISNVLLDRAMVDQAGWFRETLKVSGDFDLWVRIAERHSIGRLDEPLMALRVHDGQFSRGRDVMPWFIRENEPILETLFGRLGPDRQALATRFRRRHIHSKYAHHALRAAARGDMSLSAATWAALSSVGSPLSATAWWLATGNSRWLRVRPPFGWVGSRS
ncbi:MAG TPA: glycosyltransferase [Vicinamibacterales bacterium]|nr:glycosyltransferase [Vicinamibacterales bacterium]